MNIHTLTLTDRQWAVIIDALLIAQAKSPDSAFRKDCNDLADMLADEMN